MTLARLQAIPAALPRAVMAAALLLFLTTASTVSIAPLFDPDEGYYPATAAESGDAGRPWDPRFNGEPRWDKPILTYALIEVSFAAFGRTAAAARLPSVLEGVLLVLVVGVVVNRIAGARAAGYAAFVLCTTVGVQIFARVAHPEIGVVLAITIAELLAVLWLTDNRPAARLRVAVLGGMAIGCGVLFKGPVAIVLPLLAIATSCGLMYGVRLPARQAVRHLASSGLVALAIALPWYAVMTRRYGLPFVHEAIWRHNVGRFVGAAFVHRSRPWFFVVPTLLAMFPWSGFLPVALAKVTLRCRERTDVLRLVMASAAITSFVFYSASGSKLPHYALACVPPLAVLIGLHMRDVHSPRGSDSSGVWWTIMLVSGAAVTFAVSPFLINRLVGARQIFSGLVGSGSDLAPLFIRALWPAAVLLTLTAVALGVRRAPITWRALTLAGAVLPTLMIVSAQPLLARAYPWYQLGTCVRDSDGPVWLIGPRAPSLSFYAGRAVVRFSESEAERRPLPPRDIWIVANTDWLVRRASSPEARDRFQMLQSFGGMTLARWQGTRWPRQDR